MSGQFPETLLRTKPFEMSVLSCGAAGERPVQSNEFLRIDCLQIPQKIDISEYLLSF